MNIEIRCSSLHRPMNCMGYLSMQDLTKMEAGQPAKDGTAVGELLSDMIRQRTLKPSVGHSASNGVYLDEDMWFYASRTYEELVKTSQGNNIETEERIDWVTTSGIKIRGQFDISYTVGDTLFVEDLKYGWGIVDVKENWQLIGYAIGQVYRLQSLTGYVPAKICFRIHQPRPYHEEGTIRTWEITFQQLGEYKTQIENTMLAIAAGDKTLSTSKSCKYCEAVNVCPAFSRSYYKSVETVLNDWQQGELNNSDLKKQLELTERIEELVKIKKDSLVQLATMRMQQHQIIEGYKIAEKFGHRSWKSGITSAMVKLMSGKDISTTSMLSPAQAEKLGVSEDIIKKLTSRPSRGFDLVKGDTAAEAAKIFKTKPK